jgi:hypothetical protein
MDWDVIGNAMNLKKGAVSKRWSRLKKSMENGETPSGSVYKFLWLCVKHSARDKVSTFPYQLPNLLLQPLSTRNGNIQVTDDQPGSRLERYRREVRHYSRRRLQTLLPHEAGVRSW